MRVEKRKRLKAAGWQTGSTSDFLGLTEAEAALIEIKLVLTDAVRRARVRRKLSQAELAQRLKSSQSRVAKIEAGDASVSLELIVRALMAAGATRQEVQRSLVAGIPTSA